MSAEDILVQEELQRENKRLKLELDLLKTRGREKPFRWYRMRAEAKRLIETLRGLKGAQSANWYYSEWRVGLDEIDHWRDVSRVARSRVEVLTELLRECVEVMRGWGGNSELADRVHAMRWDAREWLEQQTDKGMLWKVLEFHAETERPAPLNMFVLFLAKKDRGELGLCIGAKRKDAYERVVWADEANCDGDGMAHEYPADSEAVTHWATVPTFE